MTDLLDFNSHDQSKDPYAILDLINTSSKIKYELITATLTKIINRKKMSDDTMPDDPDKTTRRFMTLTASGMTAVGAACAAWPLVDSLIHLLIFLHYHLLK